MSLRSIIGCWPSSSLIFLQSSRAEGLLAGFVFTISRRRSFRKGNHATRSSMLAWSSEKGANNDTIQTLFCQQQLLTSIVMTFITWSQIHSNDPAWEDVTLQVFRSPYFFIKIPFRGNKVLWKVLGGLDGGVLFASNAKVGNFDNNIPGRVLVKVGYCSFN